ncbi:MAG: hypothetical protein L3J22_04390 [Xanthomonadales bacterium]|nr:hypothetical protein [Xanthomonadales bacterium]
MKKPTVLKTTTLSLLALMAALALAGCQEEAQQALTAEEKIVAPDEHVKGLLKKAGAINKPVFSQPTSQPEAEPLNGNAEIGANMNTIIFDGSSEEAFQYGLDEFQSIANDMEISALNGAISFLKVYDIASRGNTEKLYKNLDGYTAEQIVDRASKIRKK